MRTLVFLSLGGPGLMAGYLLLTGYLLWLILPSPITFVPESTAS